MTGFYLAMGRYDMVAIVEAPSDEAIAAVVLSLGSGGGIRTETMKAFPEEQYHSIIAKLAIAGDFRWHPPVPRETKK